MTGGITGLLRGKTLALSRACAVQLADREALGRTVSSATRSVLKGQRRQVTVLFTDMVGFTKTSEALGAERTYALIHQLSELMQQLSLLLEMTFSKMNQDLQALMIQILDS